MKFLRAVFLSPTGAVRAGWVFLAFTLINGLLSFAAAKLLGVQERVQQENYDALRDAFKSAVQLLVALAATWGAMRLGRQRFGDALLADPRFVRRIGLGFLGGAAIVSVSALMAVAAGQLELSASPHPSGQVAASMGAQAAMFVPAAIWEEVMVRGLVLQQLTRGFGGLAAVLFAWRVGAQRLWAQRTGVIIATGLTALIFALGHAANPNATAFGLANIALVGFVFAALTYRQGSLWGAAGLHIGWNVCLGILWGLRVSGFDFGLSLLEPTSIGDELWTGGAFGPEASAATTAVLTVTLAIVLLMPVKNVARDGILGPALAEPVAEPLTPVQGPHAVPPPPSLPLG